MNRGVKTFTRYYRPLQKGDMHYLRPAVPDSNEDMCDDPFVLSQMDGEVDFMVLHCTRPLHHEGLHAAHLPSDALAATWEREDKNVKTTENSR